MSKIGVLREYGIDSDHSDWYWISSYTGWIWWYLIQLIYTPISWKTMSLRITKRSLGVERGDFLKPIADYVRTTLGTYVLDRPSLTLRGYCVASNCSSSKAPISASNYVFVGRVRDNRSTMPTNSNDAEQEHWSTALEKHCYVKSE